MALSTQELRLLNFISPAFFIIVISAYLLAPKGYLPLTRPTRSAVDDTNASDILHSGSPATFDDISANDILDDGSPAAFDDTSATDILHNSSPATLQDRKKAEFIQQAAE